MKIICISLGFFFFILGAVGALVPVLPTTPFLLLASACFARGSHRYDLWFKSTRLYQTQLKSFYENRAMTLKTKVTLLTLATTMMSLSAILLPHWAGKGFMGLLIVYLYYYFFYKIKTLPQRG